MRCVSVRGEHAAAVRHHVRPFGRPRRIHHRALHRHGAVAGVSRPSPRSAHDDLDGGGRGRGRILPAVHHGRLRFPDAGRLPAAVHRGPVRRSYPVDRYAGSTRRRADTVIHPIRDDRGTQLGRHADRRLHGLERGRAGVDRRAVCGNRVSRRRLHVAGCRPTVGAADPRIAHHVAGIGVLGHRRRIAVGRDDDGTRIPRLCADLRGYRARADARCRPQTIGGEQDRKTRKTESR